MGPLSVRRIILLSLLAGGVTGEARAQCPTQFNYQPTTTALAVDSVRGTVHTFTLQTTTLAGLPVSVGIVRFTVDGISIGILDLASTSTFIYDAATLAIGRHVLTAMYQETITGVDSYVCGSYPCEVFTTCYERGTAYYGFAESGSNPVSFDVAPPLRGDADGDGVFTLSDVQAALRIYLGLDTPTARALQALDLIADSRLTASDLNALIRLLIGRGHPKPS
jgi:hypothetical protein